MLPRLNILMICPAPPRSRKGNRVTADRWACLLRELGHRVKIRQEYAASAPDLLIALHARRSAEAIRRFAAEHPDRPLIVVLTGTDLYRDIRTSRAAQRSLGRATRLVVLQRHGVAELPAVHRDRARVILQSAEPTSRRVALPPNEFRVCVLGHLRSEKDPFRAARATRLLPASSRVRVVQAGAALDQAMGRWARAESARNPRYSWLGEVSRQRARRLLAASHLMVLSSRLEGGANVLSEAIVDDVPIIASDISSTRGVLGDDYPGLFPVGDTRSLARQLARAEEDARFYGKLKAWCRRLARRFSPGHERLAWRRLIAELV